MGLFGRRVVRIEEWHPVFADDAYHDPVSENVWADDYPELDDVVDLEPFEDMVRVIDGDGQEIYSGWWVGELTPHPHDPPGLVTAGVQDGSPYSCVLRFSVGRFWYGDRSVQVEKL